MLTKKTPDTIKAHLTFKAQGVEMPIMLTYQNHSRADYDAYVQNPENLKVPDGLKDEGAAIAHFNAALCLFLIKSFDDGTDDDFPLTRDGLVAMESTWPGVLVGLVRGYHQSRAGAIEKN